MTTELNDNEDVIASNEVDIQPDKIHPKIKHLVLSGGGGTGFAYYGALRESHKDGFWNINEIESMHGVSCGIIIACGAALINHIGWDDFDDYFIKRPWETVFEFSPEKILNSYSNIGIFGKEAIESVFSPLFGAVELPLNTTIKQFYDFTGIEMHFYVTDLETYELVDISFKTHPDWEVIDAIYSSCALPFLFKPSRVNGIISTKSKIQMKYLDLIKLGSNPTPQPTSNIQI